MNKVIKSLITAVKPLNIADLGTGEKAAVFRKAAVLGVIYNIQNPHLELENGRRYWEGGGIGRHGI